VVTAFVGRGYIVEYVVYTLIAAGVVGLGGKSYFQKQVALKAKAKRDAASTVKRKQMLALAAPDAATGGRKRRPQFGKRVS
jgi:hypothetical protein